MRKDNKKANYPDLKDILDAPINIPLEGSVKFKLWLNEVMERTLTINKKGVAIKVKDKYNRPQVSKFLKQISRIKSEQQKGVFKAVLDKGK